MVEILLEISGFKFLYANDEMDLSCLHFVRYTHEKIAQEEQQGADINDRIKSVQKDLTALKEMNENILEMGFKQR